MHDFTPLPALVGGLLIGLAAALLLLGHGRIAGISGLYGSLLQKPSGTHTLAAAFVIGLVASGAVMARLHPTAFPIVPTRSLGVVIAAGLLVGFGTQLGNGCTSGHGVCGIGRFSVRSLVATMTFMLTAGLTVWLLARIGVS